MRTTLLLIAILLAGCGDVEGENNPPGDGAPPADSDNPPVPDAPPPPPGFTRLIGRTWSLPPGIEDYRCVRVTLTEDTYITNIVAQAPPGTHHTVLSIASGNAAGPDGEQDNCGAATIGMVMLYASGVGTDPLDFPPDVGIKVAAGTQIHLNLHLFNATNQPLSGDTAILVKKQPTPPPMLAEMVFAGPLLFSIPATGQPVTVSGTCTANRNYTLFALWPHMHQIATHQEIELNGTVLHDASYSFADQRYYLQSPEIQVQQGDRIRVTCTYVNNTGSPVGFGESSNDEMCFAGLYRYPAANSSVFCTN